jgi:hypothetical protein
VKRTVVHVQHPPEHVILALFFCIWRVVMETNPILVEPPADICRGIGRIMANYAFAEHILQQIIYKLTGVGP